MTDPRTGVERARDAQAELASLADADRVEALEGIAASLESALADDAG
jgi:gamma-glutamyl phosphate reductase